MPDSTARPPAPSKLQSAGASIARQPCRRAAGARTSTRSKPPCSAIRTTFRSASASNCCSPRKKRFTCRRRITRRPRVDGSVAHGQTLLQHDRLQDRAERSVKPAAACEAHGRRRRRRANAGRFPATSAYTNPAAGKSSNRRVCAKTRRASPKKPSRCSPRRNVRAARFDVILGGSQVSLQMHESCGHPAELDRVMGWEANFSGVSFLELSQLGQTEIRF